MQIFVISVERLNSPVYSAPPCIKSAHTRKLILIYPAINVQYTQCKLSVKTKLASVSLNCRRLQFKTASMKISFANSPDRQMLPVAFILVICLS